MRCGGPASWRLGEFGGRARGISLQICAGLICLWGCRGLCSGGWRGAPIPS